MNTQELFYERHQATLRVAHRLHQLEQEAKRLRETLMGDDPEWLRTGHIESWTSGHAARDVAEITALLGRRQTFNEVIRMTVQPEQEEV